MVNRNLFFIIGGISAFSLYAILFILLFYYFNEHKSAKQFVPKNTNTLEVSILQEPSQIKKHNKIKAISKKTQKLPEKPKKNAIKGSTSAKHSSSSKSIATLFKGVKVGKPQSSSSLRMANAPKIKYKPVSALSKKQSSDAKSLIDNLKLSNLDIKLTSQSSGIGEVDEYMSKIYEIIFNSWHPDVLFAGLEARVVIEIFPDGRFIYKMINPSDNQSFNESLIEYLNQLQHKGFPPHKNGRKLVVELNFKPKE
ncbi:TonB C-terminal domain-containing protein [Hydrogenimonas thermophila]|uniref:TonB C-terminal domain-containing protein n=1 Tax=Hydrogenimonas thermophila TaxID=223786 RepID=UPI002936D738|nr:TonB C-terminal domain-containing protein [Hydrogenimonas thermophila]WOE70879.1 TonB C-terminal domain-containing protein [Hydrogenimonas thermophila]WOE73397.1 TonB C-terminal domain-containing protein [Hydrogenimonas thermophila]